jgi:hypothetical protein
MIEQYEGSLGIHLVCFRKISTVAEAYGSNATCLLDIVAK